MGVPRTIWSIILFMHETAISDKLASLCVSVSVQSEKCCCLVPRGISSSRMIVSYSLCHLYPMHVHSSVFPISCMSLFMPITPKTERAGSKRNAKHAKDILEPAKRERKRERCRSFSLFDICLHRSQNFHDDETLQSANCVYVMTKWCCDCGSVDHPTSVTYEITILLNHFKFF